MKRPTLQDQLVQLCRSARTMAQIVAALGDEPRVRYAVYNAVGAGHLVNLNAGQSTKIGGLFIVADESQRCAADEARVPAPVSRFDAHALVAAWQPLATQTGEAA